MKDTILLDKENNKEEKRKKKNRAFFKIGVFFVRKQLCSKPWSHEILLHAVKMDLKVQDWTIVSWAYLTDSILFISSFLTFWGSPLISLKKDLHKLSMELHLLCCQLMWSLLFLLPLLGVVCRLCCGFMAREWSFYWFH